VRTWHFEMGVAAAILAMVAALTATPETYYAEWIGALAVLLTFGHVQVADRLAESEKTRTQLREEMRSLSRRYEHDGQDVRPKLSEVFEAEDRYFLHVDCHHWARRYLVSKEICWLVYFVMLGAWSALVGVGIFLFYPVWRHYYRTKKPKTKEQRLDG